MPLTREQCVIGVRVKYVGTMSSAIIGKFGVIEGLPRSDNSLNVKFDGDSGFNNWYPFNLELADQSFMIDL
jgi:hypothetical protein